MSPVCEFVLWIVVTKPEGERMRGRDAEVGVSDRIVLRCPRCGERTILLGRENDWYSGERRAFVCACGSGLGLAHRIGEEFLDLSGPLPGLG